MSEERKWMTGDVDTILVTLYVWDYDLDEYAVFPVPLTATVTACFVQAGAKLAPSTSWSCTSGETGADWTNGIVAIPIESADTSALLSTHSDVLVEIKVVDGGDPKRWRTSLDSAIKIVKSVL